MNTSPMNHINEKLIAFTIHLTLSITVIGVFLWYVTEFWYPGNLFALEEVWSGLKILIPVDATLGPILTFILFIPNKKGLKLDLSVVTTFQILALIYGAWVIHTQRPVVLVFNVHEFEVITASEGIRHQLDSKLFNQNNLPPILLTYALPPQTEEELAHFIKSPVLIQKQASRMYPISGYAEIIKKSAIPFDSINKDQFQNKKEYISIQRQISDNPNIAILPLRGSLGNYSYVVIDIKNSETLTFFQKKPENK